MNSKTAKLIRKYAIPEGIKSDADRKAYKEAKASWNNMTPQHRRITRSVMKMEVA